MVEEIRAAGGTRMRGPAALTGDWRRAVALTWTLAYLEFRLRFFGSVLGYLWQLGRPLMMFGVYYVIFTHVVHLSGDVPFYAPMLLFSIMIFQFFAEVTSGSVGAVLNRENLVRKIHFPRLVIPMSVVVTAVLNLAVNMIAVGVFMAIQGVPVRATWLLVPIVLALLLMLVMGLAMLLSALFVRYRDVQPIWDVVLQAGFYATPILYPIDTVPNALARHLIMCNPLSVVIQQIRHWVFDPHAPTAAQAIGGAWRLAFPLGLTVCLFAIGFYVFNRMAPEVAEEL
jgi:ABC-2 type transport system permease protein